MFMVKKVVFAPDVSISYNATHDAMSLTVDSSSFTLQIKAVLAS